MLGVVGPAEALAIVPIVCVASGTLMALIAAFRFRPGLEAKPRGVLFAAALLFAVGSATGLSVLRGCGQPSDAQRAAR